MARPTAHSHPSRAPSFTGRAAELRELTEWLGVLGQADAACELFLVGGTAGAGKSRLVEEALARYSPSIVLLTGRCWPSSTVAAPYHPILDVFREAKLRQPEAWAQAVVNYPALQWLLERGANRTFPEVAEIPGKDELDGAILGALQTMAAVGPTIILLEDLHWGDETTLELLPLLADRLKGAPLRLLATFRDDELGRQHPLRRCRSTLRRNGCLREVALKPLDSASSKELLQSLLDGPVSPNLLEQLERHSGGSPLWLAEIVRSLQHTGRLTQGQDGWGLPSNDGSVPIPESFRDAVLIQCEKLGELEMKQLQVAAILGLELELGALLELTATAGDSAVEAGKALSTTLESGLLKEVGRGRAEFSHALTREVILESLNWAERRQIHGQVADILAHRGAAPETLAQHYEESGSAAEARQYYMEAALHSCHLHAYREAMAYGERALSLWPPAEDAPARLQALERLANCAKLSGKLAEAIRVLRELACHPLVGADHARQAGIQRELATLYLLQGTGASAIDARLAAAAAFERAGDAIAAGWEHLGAASFYTDRIRLMQAFDSTSRAAHIAEAHDQHELWSRALSQQGLILAMQGQVREGKAAVEKALTMALRENLTTAAAEAYRRLAMVHEYGSDYHQETQLYLEALNFCELNAMPSQSALCLGCVAYAFLRTGEWKQAMELCRNSLQQNPLGSIYSLLGKFILGMVQICRGEVRSARLNLQEAETGLKGSGQVPVEIFLAMGLAMVAEEEGDDEEAARLYLRLPEIWQQTEDRHDILPALAAAARFFGDQQDIQVLSSLAEIAAHINGDVANSEALGVLAGILGEMALVNKDAPQAIAHFSQVTAICEQLKLPYDLALALHRLGIARIAAGDHAGAVEALRKGLRHAKNLGARPLAGRITAALSQIGEAAEESRDAEAPERSVWAGLTQRQREVAQLIAQGQTNKEIAQKLFLSPRTIDMHVGHILGRLDCRTRSEAIRKLADLGVLA